MTNLSPASTDLFLSLAQDAGNWSGTPLVEVSKSEEGNLTDLKVKGLLKTMTDEGCTFAYFTDAGVALAMQLDPTLTVEDFGRFPEVADLSEN